MKMDSPRKRQSMRNMPGPGSESEMQLLNTSVNTSRRPTKGTKSFQSHQTHREILKALVPVCQKILFLETKYRLTAYAILLFFVSLVADNMPFPKTYFASRGNFLNQYFVKLSWFWTFTLTGSFMCATSNVYCCGNIKHILRHFSRLAIATMVWYFWTNYFNLIESSNGHCIIKGAEIFPAKSRRSCATTGGEWSSFDISGHAFLLTWCVLFITEEARSIIGWDGIKDLISREEYNRERAPYGILDNFQETPLKHLKAHEFENLKRLYGKFDMMAKTSLVALTALTLLWDLMLVATAVYFHIMIEKITAGLIATFMWFVLYRGFYAMEISPGMPGSGLFKYNDMGPLSFSVSEPTHPNPRAWTGSPFDIAKSGEGDEIQIPNDSQKYMGMPRSTLRKRQDDKEIELLKTKMYKNEEVKI